MNVNEIVFHSPTRGKLSFDAVLSHIDNYIRESPSDRYKVIVGADSQSNSKTKVVIVICVCRVGKGGRYFYSVDVIKKIKDIRTKIYLETKLSIDIAKMINEHMFHNNANYDFCIHADIGKNGKSSKLIKEIIGWVEAEGFTCYIKPNSFVASTIADRISK